MLALMLDGARGAIDATDARMPVHDGKDNGVLSLQLSLPKSSPFLSMNVA